MIIGVVGSKDYCNDESLKVGSLKNPDDRLGFMRALKKRLADKGVEMVPYSEVSSDKAGAYLFVNYDESALREIKKNNFQGKLFLLILECEVIYPLNWSPKVHACFDRIFTWRDDIDFDSNDKYIRIFWPNNLPRKIKTVPFDRKNKLCAMIACNKWKRRPNELYTERFSAIKWFQKNHPEDFDLYGHDWKHGIFKATIERLRNFFRRFFDGYQRPVDVSEVYKGVVDSKIETLRNYKFSICYENAHSIPGYITEKIFDCFMAGTVPVYMGWKYAGKYIPSSTFIDRRAFFTYDELYKYIKNMTDLEYDSYIGAIQDFLADEKSENFRCKSFSEIVACVVDEELSERSI